MVPLSVLDLSPITEGSDAGQALRNSLDLARHVEALGYRRVWILGSSLYGAQVAAYLGLPFAFASHFAPAMMMQAMAIYRQRFRPSAQLALPDVMLGAVVVAAESDDEARFLFSSLQQSTLN